MGMSMPSSGSLFAPQNAGSERAGSPENVILYHIEGIAGRMLGRAALSQTGRIIVGRGAGACGEGLSEALRASGKLPGGDYIV